jgi:hypothetical protein
MKVIVSKKAAVDGGIDEGEDENTEDGDALKGHVDRR